MKITLLLNCLFAFLLFTAGLFSSPVSEFGATEFKTEIKSDEMPAILFLGNHHQHENNRLLCGVECLYMVLNIFEPQRKFDVDKLLDAFPLAPENGVTLKQLKSFLKNHGYYCLIKEISEIDFSKIHPTALAIVLEKREPISHMLLKRKISDNKLQRLDPYGERKDVAISKAERERKVSLIVSKAPFPYEFSISHLFYLWGGISLFGLIFFKLRRFFKFRASVCLFLLFIGNISLLQAESPRQQIISESNDSIVCEEPDFDAGIRKAAQGELVVNHNFVFQNNGTSPVKIIELVASCSCLEMNSDVGIVPPSSQATVAVSMKLMSADFTGRKVEALVVFETVEKKRVNKSISLTAKAEFSASASSRVIDFGGIEKMDKTPQIRSFYVTLPTFSDSNDFIESIKTEFPDHIAMKVEWQKRDKRLSNDKVNYFLFVARINVMLKKFSEELLEKPVVTVKLKNGEKLDIKLNARTVVTPIFIPEKVDFRINNKEKKSTMQIMYNSASGGVPKEVRIVGDGLKVDEVVEFLPFYVYKISSNPMRGKSSSITTNFLSIITEDGKENKIEIQNHFQ